MIVGNPFPVIEHPFITDKEGKVVEEIEKNVYRPKKNENGYLGKPINPGYQSHFTLGIYYSPFFFFSFFSFTLFISHFIKY